VKHLLAFKAPVSTQGGLKTKTTVSTLLASHTRIRCKEEATHNIYHHLGRAQAEHEHFDHDEHPEGWSQRLADVGVLVDICSNCAEVQTQMDLKSAEDCPCALPSSRPVSFSCRDRIFADGLIVSRLQVF